MGMRKLLRVVDIQYLDCSDDFTAIYMCQNLSNCTLYMCSLLYANYLVKLFEERKTKYIQSLFPFHPFYCFHLLSFTII